MTGIIGKKMGMTQLFDDDGNVVAVTVVQAGPCPVTQVRTLDDDGYEAVQLAFEECKDKHISKPELGHLKKAGVKHGMRHLVEFQGLGDLKVGDTVTVEAFEDGQSVSVAGISKGKGFQGTVKRHKFGRGLETHGSHNIRQPGSVGASASPARVFKGKRMAGHMGARRVTQQGLRIVRRDVENNLLLIKGSVPGAKDSVVVIKGREQ
ncbi:MAG TPA: 50S ribosomal protein L3 [Thermoleophilia bacterium]|jgi:large subunit ribosomal protein L3|nr:50S ribosomal protein L3 [Actinomycetota bacterium]OPZ47119.1 MAG: 50S ribosomal protein L3 [Actinobacteria bacterium ADurb.BinA094]HQF51378.1 50S ribosomal protein L3 [Thermoleophilia bacterium]HQJ25821.1 50S ribosomal protein L3 [Thermoleophilia bacterium]